jgi:hypothetical protein
MTATRTPCRINSSAARTISVVLPAPRNPLTRTEFWEWGLAILHKTSLPWNINFTATTISRGPLPAGSASPPPHSSWRLRECVPSSGPAIHSGFYSDWAITTLDASFGSDGGAIGKSSVAAIAPTNCAMMNPSLRFMPWSSLTKAERAPPGQNTHNHLCTRWIERSTARVLWREPPRFGGRSGGSDSQSQEVGRGIDRRDGGRRNWYCRNESRGRGSRGLCRVTVRPSPGIREAAGGILSTAGIRK